MRVGLLANTFESSIGSVAGGHVHFLEVAKRWPEIDVVVFAPELARGTIVSQLPRATFVSMPSADAFVGNKQIRYLLRTLLALGRREAIRSCDAVLATSHFLPDLVPAMYARRGRWLVCIPHVLDSPSVRAGARIPNTITALFQSLSLALIARFAPGVLLNDDATADAIGIDRHRTDVTVMTHGIEHLLTDPAPLSNTEDIDTRPGALYVGRLVPTKGVDDLIDAWRDVARALPDARLTIAGGGDAAYVASLVERVERAGLTHAIQFAGRVSDARKAALLRDARVFVFPSKEEGWGISIAEAMAFGVPCVTYDLPAYQNVFTRGRIAAPVGDTHALASLVTRLLTVERERLELGSAARELAQSFSWQAAADIERRALVALVSRH
jgi:glycosyltransferase involved in cell wall biosynthesis